MFSWNRQQSHSWVGSCSDTVQWTSDTSFKVNKIDVHTNKNCRNYSPAAGRHLTEVISGELCSSFSPLALLCPLHFVTDLCTHYESNVWLCLKKTQPQQAWSQQTRGHFVIWHLTFMVPSAHKNNTSPMSEGESRVSASDDDLVTEKGPTSIVWKSSPGRFLLEITKGCRRLNEQDQYKAMTPHF